MKVRTLLLVLASSTLLLVGPAQAGTSTAPPPTPDVACGPGSLPETTQGRAPLADFATGRAAEGYTCNAVTEGHAGTGEGYRLERYVDPDGHECAYVDNDAFVTDQVPYVGSTGVYDVHDPSHPLRTAVLRSPAMATPHESMRLNATRGLLVAAMSTPATGPGFVDVYDIKTDCRDPKLLSSTPLGVLGHESAFAPDGKTFYVNSLAGNSIAAVDLSDPTLPKLAWFSLEYGAHGASVSSDGKTLYVAEASWYGGFHGLTILDVSQVQARVPLPQVSVISRLTWPEMSVPQSAIPFTRDGHPYVLEVDEFGERVTGAARIIDVADLKHPFVVSNLRLAVNQPEIYDELQNDPGNGDAARGYQAHNCSLPSRVDPNIVACGFLMSGLRVFDIRDVAHPRELAYFNKPNTVGTSKLGSCSFAPPAYDPASHDIWYGDGNSGFWVVRLVGPARIRFADSYVLGD